MPNLKPVLMLTNNRMLASTESGDMYYLVEEDGSQERISVEKACQVYLSNQGRKGAKPPKRIRKDVGNMPAWKRKLHTSLGILDESEPDPDDELPEYAC